MEEAENFSKQLGCKYIECSAKNGKNIENIFVGIAEDIL